MLSLTTSKISMYLPTDSQGHYMNIGTSWWRNYKSWRFYIAAEIFLFKCNVIHRLVLDFNEAVCLFLFSLHIIIESRNRTFVSFWVFIWQKKGEKQKSDTLFFKISVDSWALWSVLITIIMWWKSDVVIIYWLGFDVLFYVPPLH